MIFGVEIDNKTTIPNGLKSKGFEANVEGSKTIHDKYLNYLLFKLKVDHVWGTETQVKDLEPTATFYTDVSGNALDKNDASVSFFDDDRIVMVHNVALAANLSLDCQSKRLRIRTEQNNELDLSTFILSFSNVYDSSLDVSTVTSTEGLEKVAGFGANNNVSVNGKKNLTQVGFVGSSYSQTLVPTVIGGIIAYSATNYRDSNGDIQALSYNTTDLIDGHFMVCAGQSLFSSEYPELFARIGITYGIGVNDFQLPALNDGSFLRGFDNGILCSSIGAFQNDSMQTHTHKYWYTTTTGFSGGSGVLLIDGSLAETLPPTSPARTSSETRPRNFSVFWLIRVI